MSEKRTVTDTAPKKDALRVKADKPGDKGKASPVAPDIVPPKKDTAQDKKDVKVVDKKEEKKDSKVSDKKEEKKDAKAAEKKEAPKEVKQEEKQNSKEEVKKATTQEDSKKENKPDQSKKASKDIKKDEKQNDKKEEAKNSTVNPKKVEESKKDESQVKANDAKEESKNMTESASEKSLEGDFGVNEEIPGIQNPSELNVLMTNEIVEERVLQMTEKLSELGILIKSKEAQLEEVNNEINYRHKMYDALIADKGFSKLSDSELVKKLDNEVYVRSKILTNMNEKLIEMETQLRIEQSKSTKSIMQERDAKIKELDTQMANQKEIHLRETQKVLALLEESSKVAIIQQEKIELFREKLKALNDQIIDKDSTTQFLEEKSKSLEAELEETNLLLEEHKNESIKLREQVADMKVQANDYYKAKVDLENKTNECERWKNIAQANDKIVRDVQVKYKILQDEKDRIYQDMKQRRETDGEIMRMGDRVEKEIFYHIDEFLMAMENMHKLHKSQDAERVKEREAYKQIDSERKKEKETHDKKMADWKNELEQVKKDMEEMKKKSEEERRAYEELVHKRKEEEKKSEKDQKHSSKGKREDIHSADSEKKAKEISDAHYKEDKKEEHDHKELSKDGMHKDEKQEELHKDEKQEELHKDEKAAHEHSEIKKETEHKEKEKKDSEHKEVKDESEHKDGESKSKKAKKESDNIEKKKESDHKEAKEELDHKEEKKESEHKKDKKEEKTHKNKKEEHENSQSKEHSAKDNEEHNKNENDHVIKKSKSEKRPESKENTKTESKAEKKDHDAPLLDHDSKNNEKKEHHINDESKKATTDQHKTPNDKDSHSSEHKNHDTENSNIHPNHINITPINTNTDANSMKDHHESKKNLKDSSEHHNEKQSSTANIDRKATPASNDSNQHKNKDESKEEKELPGSSEHVEAKIEMSPRTKSLHETHIAYNKLHGEIDKNIKILKKFNDTYSYSVAAIEETERSYRNELNVRTEEVKKLMEELDDAKKQKVEAEIEKDHSMFNQLAMDERIKALEAETEEIRRDHNKKLEEDLKILRMREETLKKFKEKVAALEKTIYEKEKAIMTFSNNMNFVDARAVDLSAHIDAIHKKSIEYEIIIRETKKELNQYIHQKVNYEKQIQQKESIIEKLKTKIKVYEETMWTKETEFTKKKSKILELQQQIADQKIEMVAITERMNKAMKDQILEVEKRHKEKDSEITVLKEMLKSSKVEIKTRDSDLNRLKNKMNRYEGSDPNKVEVSSGAGAYKFSTNPVGRYEKSQGQPKRNERISVPLEPLNAGKAALSAVRDEYALPDIYTNKSVSLSGLPVVRSRSKPNVSATNSIKNINSVSPVIGTKKQQSIDLSLKRKDGSAVMNSTPTKLNFLEKLAPDKEEEETKLVEEPVEESVRDNKKRINA